MLGGAAAPEVEEAKVASSGDVEASARTAGGVVVVAAGRLAAQGGRAAAAAGGVNVTAEIALDRGLGEFCVSAASGMGTLLLGTGGGEGYNPPSVKVLKSSQHIC